MTSPTANNPQQHNNLTDAYRSISSGHGKSSESVQCAMLKACDACAVIAHCTDSEDFPWPLRYQNYHKLTMHNHVLPEERDFVAQAIGNMTIENVVTDVCNGTLHPLDLDGTNCRIEIVIQKVFFLRRLFPVELFRYFTPEAGRVVHRACVHRTILFHARTISSASNILGWAKDTIAHILSGRIYIRHFRIHRLKTPQTHRVPTARRFCCLTTTFTSLGLVMLRYIEIIEIIDISFRYP